MREAIKFVWHTPGSKELLPSKRITMASFGTIARRQKTMLWVHSLAKIWRPDTRTDDLKNTKNVIFCPPARLSSILDRFQRLHEGAFPGGRRHLQLGMSLMCNVWHLV